ncbi:hypothetical protein FSP39_015923 [Pinctada imbricata]|uniref:Uncharacterized protein n=1 Tax=Pinctada imbricata TaxID=66713 RepID=A0AA88Y569_PINIB|nr:hypothetical protein FSP39_015923 [Pinctada imbricata]
MEVMKSSNTQKSAVGMKFLKKDQTPFQKRIASIALKTGEDINDWMQSGQQRKAGNLRTPKYGLRRRPPKFPSPLYQPAASDTPSTLTGSTSRSTYVTLRGSSITPHKSLVSETPYKQVLSDIPDSRRLEIDLTARSMDLTYRSSEKSARTDSDNKTDYLTPTRSYNLPQKSYSSIGGKIKSIRDLHKVSESAPLERTVSRQNLVLKGCSLETELGHFIFLQFKSVREVTTGITGLWQPSVHSDIAFLSFDVGSSYHCEAE